MVSLSTVRAALVVVFVASAAGAGYGTSWTFDPAQEGWWLDGGKWSEGVPGLDDDAYIINGGTALIRPNETDPTAKNLYVGYTDPGNPSELRITGPNARLVIPSYGETYVGYTGAVAARAGLLTIQQGLLQIGDRGTVELASGDYALANVNITNGKMLVQNNVLKVANGDGALATLNIKGGSPSSYDYNLEVAGSPIRTGGDELGTVGARSLTTISISEDGKVRAEGYIELSCHPDSHTDLSISTGSLESVGAGNILRIGYLGSADVLHTGGLISGQNVHIAAHHQNAIVAYALSGTGHLNADAELFIAEAQGRCEFDQTGGSVTAYGSGETGMVVGMKEGAHGTFNQSGGTTTTWDLTLGQSTGAIGEYNLTGGTLTVNGELTIGAAATGTLNLGDANGVGLLTAQGPWQYTTVLIRTDPAGTGTGTLRGWSYHPDLPIVNPPEDRNHIQRVRRLVNNGQVIADSYGDDDRELRFPQMYYTIGIDNTLDNAPTESHGWFAQDHGKLVLPPIAITSSTPDYNWGEPQADDSIDLVNSLRITPTALRDSGGNLQVALLATDRSEPVDVEGPIWDDPESGSCPCEVLGVWEFSPVAPSSEIPFDTADLVIRYDHNRFCEDAPPLVLAKAILNTQEPPRWEWKVIDWAPPTLDSANHRFSKTGIAFPASGSTYIALAPGRPGDINLDGLCDVLDLLYFVDAFGTLKGDPKYDPAADFSCADSNCDDAVDVVDLLYLVDRFGCDSCLSDGDCSAQPLPELESETMGGAVSGSQQPAWQQALEQVGLLDVYMEYIAQHPEAARTW